MDTGHRTQEPAQGQDQDQTSFFYQGKENEVYLFHIKTQITAARKDIYLILAYGLPEHSMMLAANKEIRSKEDVISVVRLSMKPEANVLKVAIIKTAALIKEKARFRYYRLAIGVSGILSYSKEGIRLWFRTKHSDLKNSSNPE